MPKTTPKSIRLPLEIDEYFKKKGVNVREELCELYNRMRENDPEEVKKDIQYHENCLNELKQRCITKVYDSSVLQKLSTKTLDAVTMYANTRNIDHPTSQDRAWMDSRLMHLKDHEGAPMTHNSFLGYCRVKLTEIRKEGK